MRILTHNHLIVPPTHWYKSNFPKIPTSFTLTTAYLHPLGFGGTWLYWTKGDWRSQKGRWTTLLTFFQRLIWKKRSWKTWIASEMNMMSTTSQTALVLPTPCVVLLECLQSVEDGTLKNSEHLEDESAETWIVMEICNSGSLLSHLKSGSLHDLLGLSLSAVTLAGMVSGWLISTYLDMLRKVDDYLNALVDTSAAGLLQTNHRLLWTGWSALCWSATVQQVKYTTESKMIPDRRGAMIVLQAVLLKSLTQLGQEGHKAT